MRKNSFNHLDSQKQRWFNSNGAGPLKRLNPSLPDKNVSELKGTQGEANSKSKSVFYSEMLKYLLGLARLGSN